MFVYLSNLASMSSAARGRGNEGRMEGVLTTLELSMLAPQLLNNREICSMSQTVYLTRVD